MTQEAQVLEILERRGSITSWEAITELHITRLSEVIRKLRKSLEIVTVYHTKRVDGVTKRWGEYVLIKKPHGGQDREATLGNEAEASP